MQDFNENLESEEIVMPDAGIVKFTDGTCWLIKFTLESNPDSGGDELVAYTSEISKDDLANIEAVGDLDEHSILFVKIRYEFQFDEDSGVMEMQLSRVVALTDAMTDEPVTSQAVIETSPSDLIPIYLDVLKSL